MVQLTPFRQILRHRSKSNEICRCEFSSKWQYYTQQSLLIEIIVTTFGDYFFGSLCMMAYDCVWSSYDHCIKSIDWTLPVIVHCNGLLSVISERKHGTTYCISGWSGRNCEDTSSAWCQSKRPIAGQSSFCIDVHVHFEHDFFDSFLNIVATCSYLAGSSFCKLAKNSNIIFTRTCSRKYDLLVVHVCLHVNMYLRIRHMYFQKKHYKNNSFTWLVVTKVCRVYWDQEWKMNRL